ncbi:discoidin domain-containing protein [Bacteroides heparinolyticus]|uniref:discoidin domain-containing protein n=1 Tax=Prevotella heparinolytica TaxID=28113 RepID=UPI0035A0F64C
MTKILKNILLILFLFCIGCQSFDIHTKTNTVCNPMNLSYNFLLGEELRRDICCPCIVLYEDIYYLFASNLKGYYCSEDLMQWTFIYTNLPVPVNAPTVMTMNKELYFISSFQGAQALYKTNQPETGQWEIVTDKFLYSVEEPMLFCDEKRLFLYSGIGDAEKLTGIELDPQTWHPIDSARLLLKSDKMNNGWENPGDYNEWIPEQPWIDGLWMTRYNGKYYLQYASPGTYLKSSNSGVYISDTPEGPFMLAAHNPFAYKPEGFVTGAGNGCIFQDKYENYWYVGSVAVTSKYILERRLSLYPVFFDNDGILYAYTGFGDYPMYIPDRKINVPEDLFPDWMLLSYNKQTHVSSELRKHPACCAVDENIRSWWSAQSGNKGEYLSVDLEEQCKVNAIQINFADHDFTLSDAVEKSYYQYYIESSEDGRNWHLIADRSENCQNAPHDYIQFDEPIRSRFLRITNVHCPSRKFSLSGFRVFGKANKKIPKQAKIYTATRDITDRRKVILKWKSVDNAIGYNIRYGTSCDKLYHNYMVYDDTEIVIRSLQASQNYFFTIDSFNEGGISRGKVIMAVQ